MDPYPYTRVGWDGKPIPPDPVDIYTIHDWEAVDEAVRLYRAGNVELAIHPNASLRFANEFVKEFKTGPGAEEEGYRVLNPSMAYCKSDMFKCLHPHVRKLAELAQRIRAQITKAEAVVSEMISKHANAERNIFATPSHGAKVIEPFPETEQVYLQVTSKRGLDLIAAAAKKHLPILPAKCTTIEEMKAAQPSEADVQKELYRLNLQFLQEKLKLLGSIEEQVKKIHLDMDVLLLGNTSVGSARTVMDFMDIDLMKCTNSMTTADLSPISKNSKRARIPQFSVEKTGDADDKIGGSSGNSTPPKTLSLAMKNKSPEISVKKTGTPGCSSKRAKIKKQ